MADEATLRQGKERKAQLFGVRGSYLDLIEASEVRKGIDF